MTRQRKPGLRIHKASQRYYITDPQSRKEVYFGKVADGLAAAKMRYPTWKFFNEPRLHQNKFVVHQSMVSLSDPDEVFLIATPKQPTSLQEGPSDSQPKPPETTPTSPAPAQRRSILAQQADSAE